MRTFRFYIHPSGAYELLPRGWSFWALILGPLWAIGSGVFSRYAKVMGGPFLLLAVGLAMLDIEMGGWAAIGSVIVGALWFQGASLYFAAYAFDWRSELLEQNGYEFVTGQDAWTARQALRKWSKTKAATRIV